MFHLLSLAAALAPLEPAGKGVLFGPWYERLNGDTPAKILQRTNLGKVFSLYQSDMNITNTAQAPFIDNFLAQVQASNTDAIMYLTLYPSEGFAAVTPAGIEEFANSIKKILDAKRKVLIRYASEMNGNWFKYGRQPLQFIQSWRQVVTAVRAKAGAENKDNYAFIWAPNSGNGYPFGNFTGDAASIQILDTNGDGVVGPEDDPYSPYYPGNEWIYHYGKEWPWETNDIATPNKVPNILTGAGGDLGRFNFYELFCSNPARDKPFIITETSSTIHLAKGPGPTSPLNVAIPGGDELSRAEIKRNWWRQIFNEEFLSRFPKIKAVSTFEFIKYEETTWRDFTNMGKGTEVTSNLGNDGGALDGKTLEYFQEDFKGPLSQFVIWGKGVELTGTPVAKNSDQGRMVLLAAAILCLL